MISVILPFYNEKGNLQKLYNELIEFFGTIDTPFELVFVDDGSDDESSSIIKKLMKKDSHVTLASHFRRRGKGYALATGVEHAKGNLLVFMDSDLQNDPQDIALFLEKINEGYDYVNGIRDKRHDNSFIKSYSKVANDFVRKFLDSPFTDVNCGFKMFKKKVLDDIPLYANNFRFLPLAVYLNGYHVTEVTIKNRDRGYGVSKFGTMKVFTGILDTLTAYFLYRFAERPLHFFGVVGGVSFVLGFVIAFVLTIERLFLGKLLYQRPMLTFATLLMIVGIQVLMTGFIGELIVYFHKKKKV